SPLSLRDALPIYLHGFCPSKIDSPAGKKLDCFQKDYCFYTNFINCDVVTELISASGSCFPRATLQLPRKQRRLPAQTLAARFPAGDNCPLLQSTIIIEPIMIRSEISPNQRRKNTETPAGGKASVRPRRTEFEEAHQPPAESDERNIHRVICELRGVLLHQSSCNTTSTKCFSEAVLLHSHIFS